MTIQFHCYIDSSRGYWVYANSDYIGHATNRKGAKSLIDKHVTYFTSQVLGVRESDNLHLDCNVEIYEKLLELFWNDTYPKKGGKG